MNQLIKIPSSLNWPQEIPLLLDSINEFSLLILLSIVTICILITKNLVACTILMSLFSLVMTLLYAIMHAGDVAMTEAAINSCISTIFIFITINIVSGNKFNEMESKGNFSTIKLVLCLFIAIILAYIVMEFPSYGTLEVPIHQHVANYYIENSGQEMGIPSVVASILGSYRAYDTLGETIVILTAALSIFILLGPTLKKTKYNIMFDKNYLIIIISRFIMPFIILFSLYIQFHGEMSPGGGFQAGAIFASAFILYILLFGKENVLSISKLMIICCLGALLYLLTGIAGIYLDAEFLNYNILARDPVIGQKIGIFLIELGVGITVASVIISIFLLIKSSKGSIKNDNCEY